MTAADVAVAARLLVEKPHEELGLMRPHERLRIAP